MVTVAVVATPVNASVPVVFSVKLNSAVPSFLAVKETVARLPSKTTVFFVVIHPKENLPSALVSATVSPT